MKRAGTGPFEAKIASLNQPARPARSFSRNARRTRAETIHIFGPVGQFDLAISSGGPRRYYGG